MVKIISYEYFTTFGKGFQIFLFSLEQNIMVDFRIKEFIVM